MNTFKRMLVLPVVMAVASQSAMACPNCYSPATTSAAQEITTVVADACRQGTVTASLASLNRLALTSQTISQPRLSAGSAATYVAPLHAFFTTVNTQIAALGAHLTTRLAAEGQKTAAEMTAIGTALDAVAGKISAFVNRIAEPFIKHSVDAVAAQLRTIHATLVAANTARIPVPVAGQAARTAWIINPADTTDAVVEVANSQEQMILAIAENFTAAQTSARVKALAGVEQIKIAPKKGWFGSTPAAVTDEDRSFAELVITVANLPEKPAGPAAAAGSDVEQYLNWYVTEYMPANLWDKNHKTNFKYFCWLIALNTKSHTLLTDQVQEFFGKALDALQAMNRRAASVRGYVAQAIADKEALLDLVDVSTPTTPATRTLRALYNMVVKAVTGLKLAA